MAKTIRTPKYVLDLSSGTLVEGIPNYICPSEIKFKTRRIKNVVRKIIGLSQARRYMNRYMKGEIKFDEHDLKLMFTYLEYDNFAMLKAVEVHNRNWNK